MGHMNSIIRKTTVIATLFAVCSLGFGFTPQTYAGTVGPSIDLGFALGAVCGVTAPDVTGVTLDDDANPATPILPGAIATATFDLTATGSTAVQLVQGDVGAGFAGTFTGLNNIRADHTTLQAIVPLGTDPSLDLGPVPMVRTPDTDIGVGVPTGFVFLIAEETSTVTVSVDTNPLDYENLPVAGGLTTSLNLTVDLVDCTDLETLLSPPPAAGGGGTGGTGGAGGAGAGGFG